MEQQIHLRPALPEDKVKIFDWLTNSDLTREMLGPPTFPEIPVPTWEEFSDDYVDHYFDDTQPLLGRCFIIEYRYLEIGQINYNYIDATEKSTEIDIWLAGSHYTGKGLGIQAIGLICDYLYQNFECKKIYIAPSQRNTRALKAYKKAGFLKTKRLPRNFIPDYRDSIVFVKTT
ncbi:MAG: GNAT family N-acetyltransferase [Lewinellaceae bacterium]|nr:GNAT family N-acetyltransferase [Lewinellaceae bacterium]